MSARKTVQAICLAVATSLLPVAAIFADNHPYTPALTSLESDAIAKQLGWVASPINNCGGYYLEEPLVYPESVEKNNTVEITMGGQSLFSLRGTSIAEGKVSLTRAGQQITANNGYLYRNPTTGKLSAVEMKGNVNLREANTLIVATQGRYNLDTNTKSLLDVLYRATLSTNKTAAPQDISKEHRITSLTAWGHADKVDQTDPKIYELTAATFSTCPPTSPAWHVKGSHIDLNYYTGRGSVTNARIYVKSLPVFYFPYINFSIDHQRKTGFLWPTVGIINNKWGPYILAPIYLNLAPNYDMTVTPGILTKRGVQLSDNFRYLTEHSEGTINVSVLPDDKDFLHFQNVEEEKYSSSTDPFVQAELQRLLNDSPTRKSLEWRDMTRYNENWSSNIDFNYAGDDYYLQDFGSSLNEVTQNQLLQKAEVNYKGPHWNFTGRMQAYQTLHPIIEGQGPVQNQYRRFPQLLLGADYPDQALGLEYFMNDDFTHFDFRKTPGMTPLPIGNRMHVQPGVSLPLYWPYLYVNPRMQLALTDYQLYQIGNSGVPGAKHRAIPIFDVAMGLAMDQNFSIFGHAFDQTFEPQFYYTYIPYRNQSSIPIFDTTVNTLTYDQLFNYNRFSGLDRIGDANQVGVGMTTRFIDGQSGLEKIRLGVGDIIYFANREVTLCNNPLLCTDNPDNPDNHRRLSPISGMFNYAVNRAWNFSANSIWNPVSKQLDNSTLGLHYEPDEAHIVNLGYSYVFNGDVQSGSTTNSTKNNLKLTDFSLAWPLSHDFSFVGRWSQDWNLNRMQNLLSGLQYDTCCWAVRLVGGRAFTQLQNNTPQYNNQFYIQFALKGLGNIGSGNPTGLLSSINGYNTQFGQEI